jgi:hypothetical protein
MSMLERTQPLAALRASMPQAQLDLIVPIGVFPAVTHGSRYGKAPTGSSPWMLIKQIPPVRLVSPIKLPD